MNYLAMKDIFDLFEKRNELKNKKQELKVEKEWFLYYNLPLDEF